MEGRDWKAPFLQIGEGAAGCGRGGGQAGCSWLGTALPLGLNCNPLFRARSSWQRRSYQSLDSGLSACWLISSVTRGMCRESSHAAASLRSLLRQTTGLTASLCLWAAEGWRGVRGFSWGGQPQVCFEGKQCFALPEASASYTKLAGTLLTTIEDCTQERVKLLLSLSVFQRGNLKFFSQGHKANTYQNEGDRGLRLLPLLLVSLPLG